MTYIMVDGEINPDEVLLGDQIVGIEDVRYENGKGFSALQPRTLPSPKKPTAAQRAKHDANPSLRTMVPLLCAKKE